MNIVEHLSALQVVVPLLSAPLIALLRPHGLAWAAATLASLMAFAIAVALTSGILGGQTRIWNVERAWLGSVVRPLLRIILDGVPLGPALGKTA